MSYRKSRLVVKFKLTPSDSEATVQNLSEEILALIPKGELVRRPSKSGRAVFAVSEDVDLAKLADELSQHERIAYAEPDIVDTAVSLPPERLAPD